MSVLDNQTKINPTTAFYGTGSGGGGSNFNIINVSTIDMQPNGDINWNGSLNFQGADNGGAVLASTSGIIGGDPTTTWSIYAPDGIHQMTTAVDTNGIGLIQTGPIGLVLSAPQVVIGANLQVSSINGDAYPPPAPTAPINSVAFAPNNIYTYVPAGGATVAIGATPALSSQHFYQLSINFRFSLESNAAPTAADNIGISFAGNFNNYPNNFTQSCALISSLQNDVYASYSAVLKANNNSPALIQAYGAPAPAYSTSVGVESFMVITDLGAF